MGAVMSLKDQRVKITLKYSDWEQLVTVLNQHKLEIEIADYISEELSYEECEYEKEMEDDG